MSKTPTALACLALVIGAAAVAIERAAPDTWHSRLLLAEFTSQPNRHTPRFASGTFLPPALTKNTTLSPAQNPVILAGTTTIPAGVTLAIEPGTRVFVHEFSGLHVSGTLRLRGTAEQPVTFFTNEVHPENQVWNGLIFNPGSRGDIAHALIEHASPAVSCLAQSSVAVSDSRFRTGSVGVYAETPSCQVTNTPLHGFTTDIIKTY